MKVLVINSGSSSLKYKLIESKTGKNIAKGLVERIGLSDAIFSHKSVAKEDLKKTLEIKDHSKAISLVLDILVDEKHGDLKSLEELEAVGHRVAHGGENYDSSVFIDDEVIKNLEECSKLAPLHNPANLMGIYAVKKILPKMPMVAVFDTAFHHSMPKEAYTYAIPHELSKKYSIRRYGFHGTSHKFVMKEAAKILKKDMSEISAITCHLGNGSSICAIKNGKSIDTSMGFTPLEGLVMGTRSGDLDASILNFISKNENINLDEVENMLNKKSGLLGISGISNDMRDLHAAASKGNDLAKLAVDVFSYRIKKYIGSYATALNKLDLIIFTGGIGEKDEIVREKVCSNMEILGISLDKEKNNNAELYINDNNSKVKLMIIPTNEELMIAKDTANIVENLKK